MARTSLAACIAAALSFCTIENAIAAPAGPLPLRIAPGQTAHQALFLARLHSRFGGMQSNLPAVSGAKAFSPTITSGAVVSGTLTVGQAGSIPTLQFTFKVDKAGFNGAEFVFASPNGNQSLAFTYFPQDYQKSATITFSPDSNAPYYAQPGQWVLTSASIQDNQYNYTQYDQAQLAQLFTNPYLTVVNNGPVDVTAPVVTAGKILTPKISLSSPVRLRRVQGVADGERRCVRPVCALRVYRGAGRQLFAGRFLPSAGSEAVWNRLCLFADLPRPAHWRVVDHRLRALRCCRKLLHGHKFRRR